MTPKIVVLTPVRNEAWILDRFLSVTSRFADLIIIADQNSTDGSRDIYPRYPKAVMVDNSSAEFNEAGRQLMLLSEARRRVPEPRLLLALDADEILAADAMRKDGWRTMLAAAPGTVLCFEKPDLLSPPDRCVRYDTPWPLGYVDDGAAHEPKVIHSIRIPQPANAPRLATDDVKILHYALTRPDVQRAKCRMYSALENLQGVSTVAQRRLVYADNRDWSGGHRVEPIDPAWFAGWEQAGIDMRSTVRQPFYWQDFEVLRLFARHGTRRFWLDDVWNQDWEACRQYGLRLGEKGLPDRPVRSPPVAVQLAARLHDAVHGAARRAWRWVKRPRPTTSA